MYITCPCSCITPKNYREYYHQYSNQLSSPSPFIHFAIHLSYWQYKSDTFILYTISFVFSTFSVLSFWYRWWDSNPHGFPPDFESGASASSATSACDLFILSKNELKFKYFSSFFWFFNYVLLYVLFTFILYILLYSI